MSARVHPLLEEEASAQQGARGGAPGRQVPRVVDVPEDTRECEVSGLTGSALVWVLWGVRVVFGGCIWRVWRFALSWRLKISRWLDWR